MAPTVLHAPAQVAEKLLSLARKSGYEGAAIPAPCLQVQWRAALPFALRCLDNPCSLRFAGSSRLPASPSASEQRPGATDALPSRAPPPVHRGVFCFWPALTQMITRV